MRGLRTGPPGPITRARTLLLPDCPTDLTLRKRLPAWPLCCPLLSARSCSSAGLSGVDLAQERRARRGHVKANGAIAFLMTGTALLLVIDRAASRRRVRAARADAGAAGLLALAVLTQYLFDYDLGIDELLFAETQRGARHLLSQPHGGEHVGGVHAVRRRDLADRRPRGQVPAGLRARVRRRNDGFVGLWSATSAGPPISTRLGTWNSMSIPAALGFVVLGGGLLALASRAQAGAAVRDGDRGRRARPAPCPGDRSGADPARPGPARRVRSSGSSRLAPGPGCSCWD